MEDEEEAEANYDFESVDDLKTELRRCILTLINNNAKLIEAQDTMADTMDKLHDLAKKLE